MSGEPIHIQRYSVVPAYAKSATFEPRPDGLWVKWEDAVRLRSDLVAAHNAWNIWQETAVGHRREIQELKRKLQAALAALGERKAR